MKKIASLIVVVAIVIAAALTAPQSAQAAQGISVAVDTNGVVLSPTNTTVKFPPKGITLQGNVQILGIASNSVTVLAGPIYSNAPNGSLCLTTNGQMWIKSNAVWVAK